MRGSQKQIAWAEMLRKFPPSAGLSSNVCHAVAAELPEVGEAASFWIDCRYDNLAFTIAPAVQRAGATHGQGQACALAFRWIQFLSRDGVSGGSWAPQDGETAEQAAARQAPRLVWAAGKLLMGIQEGDLWLAAEITKRACPAAAQAVDAAIGLGASSRTVQP